MNKELSVVLLAIGFSALVGCSAAGVVASSDPQQKLADADALLDQGRPLPAERLIAERATVHGGRGSVVPGGRLSRVWIVFHVVGVGQPEGPLYDPGLS